MSEKKSGWFQRLKQGLSKSASNLTQNITGLFTKRRLDAAALEELEDLLIGADLGPHVAMEVSGKLARDKFNKEVTDQEIKQALADVVGDILTPVAKPLAIDRTLRPHVILVVGVNGTGKTTTIGKMAKRLQAEGHRVLLGAADTFRAAAIEQLQLWGERTGTAVVAGKAGSDPASIAFATVERAQNEGFDVALIDTAGRLQNKQNLMAELEKVARVIRKRDETAPHDVLLVLDATTGQNALNQVDVFQKVANVSGLVMTKLDGTARGGVLVAVAERFALPVHFIGVGEGADDLQAFDAAEFAGALTGVQDAEIASP